MLRKLWMRTHNLDGVSYRSPGHSAGVDEFHARRGSEYFHLFLTDKLASTHDSDTHSYADKRTNNNTPTAKKQMVELGHTMRYYCGYRRTA